MTAQPETAWIAIARTGTWKDSSGKSHTFTTRDFDAIIRNYDPATEEAPLVFGHPAEDAPAYGWVQALRRDGETLLAQLAQVPAAVREVVQSGAYRYVSMALHPGGDRLRHVGLLGAVPPAIKGLGPVQLADGEGVVSIQFAASGREAPGGTMTPEELQKRLGALEQQLQALNEANAALKEQLATSEKGRAEAEQAKATAEEGKATVEAEFSAYRGEQVKASRMARLERLTAEGRVTPGEHKDILAQVEALSKVPDPVEFSDGVKETLEERLWKGLEARTPSGLAMTFSAPGGPAHGPAQPPFRQPEASAPDLSRKI